jgi:hypothetical protein
MPERKHYVMLAVWHDVLKAFCGAIVSARMQSFIHGVCHASMHEQQNDGNIESHRAVMHDGKKS